MAFTVQENQIDFHIGQVDEIATEKSSAVVEETAHLGNAVARDRLSEELRIALDELDRILNGLNDP